jgi:transcriptional regulator with XRE-family HTH domain
MSEQSNDYSKINKIRMLREGIGLSQDYVAKKLNITQQAYSKIEKSPNTATLERLIQISEVLGVNINSIVGDDDKYIQQNFHQQGENASTVMYITGLADRERALFMQQIESLQKQVEVLTKIIDQKL